ncbi:MAG TPA: hypothetical protein VGI32_12590, partial [Steroidobacteraceae bacterium]
MYYLIIDVGGTPFTLRTEYKALTGRDVFSEAEITYLQPLLKNPPAAAILTIWSFSRIVTPLSAHDQGRLTP